MGVNINIAKKLSVNNININDNPKKNSLPDNFRTDEKATLTPNTFMDKSSIIDVYSQKSPLEVYSISGGFPVESQLKEIARQSIVSIKSEKEKLDKEKWYQILLQVSVPFFIAGIGTIGAGILLSRVTKCKVFSEVTSLFVLIPALLGLKGNLDMCLASRLSTQANLGKFENRKDLMAIIVGNVFLVQVQAIVASIVVSIFAVAISALVNGNFKWTHTLLLATASTLTATISCFTLDLVLVTVIVLSHKLKLNPDNIATPMAASIGDVVSLMTLTIWASFLFDIHDEYQWLLGVILGMYILVLLPIWIYIVHKNEYTKKILTQGWVPVLSALFISGCGGLVLDLAIDQFNGYAIFQPIINGIGGNLVSVQASRISTMLHKTSFKGIIPLHTKQFTSPFKALIRGVLPAKSARILLLLSIPGQLVFVIVADAIAGLGHFNLNVYFVLTYLTVSFVQIVLLLYICHVMVHTMWKLRMDPDNSAIPYLTALGDLLGSTLLLAGFYFLKEIGYPYMKIDLRKLEYTVYG